MGTEYELVSRFTLGWFFIAKLVGRKMEILINNRFNFFAF